MQDFAYVVLTRSAGECCEIERVCATYDKAFSVAMAIIEEQTKDDGPFLYNGPQGDKVLDVWKGTYYHIIIHKYEVAQ